MGLLSLCPHYKEQTSKLLCIQKSPRLSCKNPIFSSRQMFSTLFNAVVFNSWFKQGALQLQQPSNTMYFPSFYQLVITKSCSHLLGRFRMTGSLHGGEHAESGGGRGVLLGRLYKQYNQYTRKNQLPGRLILWRLLKGLVSVGWLN